MYECNFTGVLFCNCRRRKRERNEGNACHNQAFFHEFLLFDELAFANRFCHVIAG